MQLLVSRLKPCSVCVCLLRKWVWSTQSLTRRIHNSENRVRIVSGLRWRVRQYNELQWVAVSCSELQWVMTSEIIHSELQWVAASCSELQWVMTSETMHTGKTTHKSLWMRKLGRHLDLPQTGRVNPVKWHSTHSKDFGILWHVTIQLYKATIGLIYERHTSHTHICTNTNFGL